MRQHLGDFKLRRLLIYTLDPVVKPRGDGCEEHHPPRVVRIPPPFIVILSPSIVIPSLSTLSSRDTSSWSSRDTSPWSSRDLIAGSSFHCLLDPVVKEQDDGDMTT